MLPAASADFLELSVNFFTSLESSRAFKIMINVYSQFFVLFNVLEHKPQSQRFEPIMWIFEVEDLHAFRKVERTALVTEEQNADTWVEWPSEQQLALLFW